MSQKLNPVQDGTSWYERNQRWFVLGTLFLATFLSYFDRQMLGAAMTPIGEEFQLTNAMKGNLLAAFLWTYAGAHLFVGLVLDRIRNIRWFFPAMVLGWSATTVCAGLATTYHQLLWTRYLLGIWESVNFPICIMLIARIFPARERSLASGIFASGAFIATLIAPKVVIYFSTHSDWRHSFFLAGLVGGVWLVPWLLIYRPPARRERTALEPLASDGGSALTPRSDTLLSVVCAPAFWAVALIGIGIIPSLYFSTQWLPTCLEKSLHLTYDQKLGNYLLAIYLMQDAGLWIGGAAVLWLARRGVTILTARKAVIVVGYLMMISIVLLTRAQTTLAYLAVFCCFTFGIGIFLGNQHAFKQDVVKGHVATVAAWVGFIEMMFTAFVVQRVGKIIGTQADFGPVYLVLAGLTTLALLVVFILLRPRWLRIE
ncbi:MAG: MFS transporter [Planctomycetes bacterium]|jgi:ACS family hexuronate transporter-like MFS transporter|nr:MFS transporter [Planctomycetota bacterium]